MMAKIRSILTVCVLLVGCSQSPSGPIDDAFRAIDQFVLYSMEANGTPGLALAVTTGDGLLYSGTYGYADLKNKTPVTPETLFQIGSITKSFTALGLMHLWDEGVFDPRKPVADYLPWFSVQSEFEPIAGHHLLSHTAGIPANRDDIFGSPYMAWALREQATAWPPGERFLYSNVGYQVLHVLLEELSGETYGEYIERLILEPLEMDQTNAAITLESRSSQAIGYIQPYDDRPAHRSRPLVEAPFHAYAIGDGCIQSTASDMAAYVRMLLNRGHGPRSRLVSEEAFDRFASPHIQPSAEHPEEGYGYGIYTGIKDGHQYLRHSGGMVGLYAYIAADVTDGLGVVVLVNGPAEMRGIAEYALRAVAAADRGEDPPPMPDLETDPALVENASDYAGIFRSESGLARVFEADGSSLFLRIGDEKIDLETTGEDSFYTPHPDFDRYAFVFGRDDEGSVVEVSHGPSWYINERYSGPRQFEIPAGWLAYTGRYRSFSPWFSYFEVFARKGLLLVVTGEGAESSSGETVLVPLGDGAYQIGKEPTPEVLRFDDPVAGRALRATWSGHPLFRVSQ
jgi:D-alanyl-D-alanine carboxypeptidase